MALNPRQFRMQTNIKVAPNSQGTLFQGGNPTPATGKPWPRGHSPERRDEVVEAMDDWPGSGGYPRVHANLGSKHLQDYQRTYKGPHTAEVAATVSNIARSTIPAHHISGARYTVGIDKAYMPDAALGVYRKARGYKEHADVHIREGSAGTTTPIHEIGHHVSATVDRNEHADYSNATQRGHEEAYAENYAETHFRDRRGRPAPGFTTDASKWAGREDTQAGANEFTRSFNQRRRAGSPGIAARRAEELARSHSQQSPTGIVGQTALVSKVYGDAKQPTQWAYTTEDQHPSRPGGPLHRTTSNWSPPPTCDGEGCGRSASRLTGKCSWHEHFDG